MKKIIDTTSIAGNLGNSKIKKGKYNQNHKERHYIIKKPEEIKQTELKIKRNNIWFPKLTIVEGRKPDRGVN